VIGEEDLMTRYGVDAEGSVWASWAHGGTGAERAAKVVANAHMSEEHAFGLAERLTGLSEAVWRTITHPSEAAAGSVDEPNSEAWRLGRERERMATVLESVLSPNLPMEDGSLVREYSRVGESAHRVGRLLCELADPDVSAAVIAEVREELAAVESAHAGDLRGRASQAVALTSVDPAPTQVVAADLMFHDDPFGSGLEWLDQTAAAIAGLRWLHAAALVAGQAAQTDPLSAVMEADDIVAMPTRTLRYVMERVVDERPRELVTGLVRDAVEVGEGRAPSTVGLIEALEGIEEYAALHGVSVAEIEVSLCLLDPKRPAADLLEDLLSGIHGCWLVYLEYELEHHAENEEEYEAAEQMARRMFIAEVRAEAALLPPVD
jgi:hypothetical protein